MTNNNEITLPGCQAPKLIKNVISVGEMWSRRPNRTHFDSRCDLQKHNYYTLLHFEDIHFGSSGLVLIYTDICESRPTCKFMRIPNDFITLSDHSVVSRIHLQLSRSRESKHLLRNYVKGHGQSELFFEAAFFWSCISVPNGKKMP